MLSTVATTRSGAFVRELKAIDPAIEPVASGSPARAFGGGGQVGPRGPGGSPRRSWSLRDVRAAGVDTLILGCTHFPLLSEAIAAYMGEGVTLIDSGAAGARALAALLEKNSLRSPRRSFGRTACYASGDPVEFARVAELFLRRDMSNTVFKTAVL
ncbi:MAG: aspartate/glutamate racemase family protein [Oscillospiraceae bacterium]